MIRDTLNHWRNDSQYFSFWKHQLRNYSLSDELNVQFTRPQLLELLECFKENGLNILTKDDVKSQYLASPRYEEGVGFRHFEAVNMLVRRFGLDIMAYDGRLIREGWRGERDPAVISDIDITYEIVRENLPSLVAARNVPSLVASRNLTSRKRKYDNI